jgi:hypothetical protein
MVDGELARMQRQPVDQRLLVRTTLVSTFQVRQFQGPIGHAIEAVAENGSARSRQMHTQLVGATGHGAALDPGVTRAPAAAKPLQRAKPGLADLAAPFLEHPHPPRVEFILAEGQFDREVVGQQARGITDRLHHFHRLVRRQDQHQGMVDLRHGFRLKLSAEKIERDLGFRAEQDAARVGIETVDVCHPFAEGGMDQTHQILARLVPAIRRHQQAAGFVERDHDIIVMEDGRKRHPAIGTRAALNDKGDGGGRSEKQRPFVGT